MSSAGRYRFVRLGLLSALVGVLACVSVAAPVFAFVSRRTHIVIVPAGAGWTFGSSTATCPSGQHVLFGGFENGLAGMRRTASNRWTVYGINLSVPDTDSGPPIALYSLAYCGFGPVASKATSTVDLSGGTSGSATARCPAGTVVVAGGFATTPDTVVGVTGLERVAADLWRVSVSLLTRPAHSALTSIAYCGPGPAPTLVSRTIKNYVSGPVRATCPVGRHLVFGGAIDKGYSAYLTILRARTKDTWSVAGESGRRTTLTALAYCG